MVDVKIKIALGLIAILVLAAPIAIAQEVPPHVVISEVQIATNEFVELYNPTNSDINMTGWHWCYFSPGGNWNKSERDRTFPDEAIIIPAHGFYLIATTEGDFPTADWNLNYKAHFLSNTAGSVGIFPWDPDTKTAEEAKAGKIDAVGWGSATYVYETATASTPGSGKSIERKPLKDGYAPCQDTDDNSADFDEPGTPTPKNSSSPEMEPAPVELFDADGNFKGGFVNIQDAVDTAFDGYTIRVDNGTYEENLDVDKPLTVRSEHGAAVTTVSASDPNDNVIAVTADSVAISGFDVTGATDNAGGIYLKDVKHCNIIDNSASNNNIGILLYQSNYNTITNNNVSDNENGISLSSSDDNSICNNYFDNTNNAIDDGNNVWNIAKIGGTNIIGGPYLGGNYWSDYAGADTDNDGLGDFLLPYNSCGDIEDGGDRHPLVPVGSAPKLSIEKSDELDALPPGGTLRYTIIVKNTGNATATKVNVTDTYDANVTFASAVPIPSQGNDTWIFPMLNVSETKWINISVTVNSATPIGTVLNNSVNVSCDEGDTDTDTEATTVSAGYAPPEITSFAPDSPVNDAVGAWRTFNVTVNQSVNVVWYLDDSSQHTNNSVKEASFKFQAVEGEHNVTANASDVYGSDSYSWVWNVKQQEISVTKVGNVTEASPSTLVNFTITVSNIGDCALHTVVVNDTLPAGMTYNSSDPSANTTTGAIIWDNVGPLAAGASETITLVVQIGENAEGVLNNTVNVTGMPPTGDSVSATDTAQVRVKQPGISVTKGNVTGAPSTLVKFTITVSNTGDFTLNHVVVNDTLPAKMTYKSSDTPAYTPDGINITWNITGSLDVGASKTITLVARIGENATGELTNTVNVTGTLPTGDKVYDDATAQVRVIRVEIKKSCKSSTVSLGGTVEYTIKYFNRGEVDLTDVVITENYPKILTFTSAVPAPDPGTNNKWTIGTLPVDGSGTITIKMKVPASMTDFSYTESGSVSGEGIVMISKELSTKVEPFDLKNVVTISGSYGAINVSATASAITTVGVSGSSLEITEHGSGLYKSEEELSVSPENMGIKFDKTTNAEYSPTTFKCSDGFVMEVPSKWSQDICIKNYVKKSAIHKTITEATYMNDNTIINTDNKGYSMKFDSTFLGYLHVDKKTKDAATSEHYIGEFVITSWDQSGKEIVEGVGYVIVDKELSSGRLLLMEHGSGYYLSEEDSSSSSIKKITVAEYEPTSFYFSDGFVVNFSSKWMQDICARSGTGTSALRKKIRDATFIDDDTTAKSSPSLKFETFFYGATHVGSKSQHSKASEDYIGDFYISWGASSIFIFDWGDVPGPDNADLIDHLSGPKFNMSWVTDDDVEITKSSNKCTITISTPEHSAEIILDTETDESAELIVDGVDTYTFNVVKHGDTLKVYDPEFERKPELVTGEGFVMIDEAIFRDGEIQVTEHGSGTYYSEEAFDSKKRIEKSTYGKYKPTSFSFSDSFAVNFSSMWLQDICAKDEDEGTVIHKKISDASFMKDDTIAAKSLMNITSSFNGSMHIGVRTENVSISEDYIGEFNVTQRIKIVKEEPPKSSSESSDWLFCPCPIPSSIYQWFCQDPTYRVRWLSVCPYPYKDHWLYIHP